MNGLQSSVGAIKDWVYEFANSFRPYGAFFIDVFFLLL
jgi:hypothetical protein